MVDYVDFGMSMCLEAFPPVNPWMALWIVAGVVENGDLGV